MLIIKEFESKNSIYGIKVNCPLNQAHWSEREVLHLFIPALLVRVEHTDNQIVSVVWSCHITSLFLLGGGSWPN